MRMKKYIDAAVKEKNANKNESVGANYFPKCPWFKIGLVPILRVYSWSQVIKKG